MQAVEEARIKDNQGFYSRDAQRKEDALVNGTLPVKGSMSVGTGNNAKSYGASIQRDQYGQKVTTAPTGAKPVRQSIINGVVYDHYANGSTQQNQALTEQYATTGQKPVLIQNQSKQRPAQRRPTTQTRPVQTSRLHITGKPAGAGSQVGSKPGKIR
jgi:hypothetical protein